MTTIDPTAPRGRVLLVEDDFEAASFAIQVLAVRNGFEVVRTADPAAALRLASSESWDLVLTDVEMPGMTGIELLESLRRTDPYLPVAVVTAHATVDVAVGALRNRADDFQEKPLRPARLVAMVTELVAKGRAARLARRQVVLAIGAHPDDVEIGASGALIAHREMGHDIAVPVRRRTLCRGIRGDSRRRWPRGRPRRRPCGRPAVCPRAVGAGHHPCPARRSSPEVPMTRHDIAARPIRVLVTGAGGPAAVSVLKSLRIAMVRFLEECFIELGEVRRVAA